MAKAAFLGVTTGALVSSSLYWKLGFDYRYRLASDLHSLRPAFALPMMSTPLPMTASETADAVSESAVSVFREQWNRPFQFLHRLSLR
eukprot:CAMPEP_0174229818 /NCGR_PEP_ID=MMETSP0417-20130205/705_1 /TAXON_ID=242541 /ORGANISM="Mayorella sp, Strain BSH-02190019" /LENGTH=87 /DNA_ID=CAMNT_0015307407 /DNA_START=56 /DNA_END=316 /DNA_ORIENTATION=-